MSKFCNNCGSMLEDDAVFCTNCGTQSEPAVEETPAEDFVESPADAVAEVPADNKKTLITLAIAGAALVAAIILLIAAFSSTPKKAMANLEKAMNGKVSAVSSLAPKAYWKYLKDEEDVTKADVKDELKDGYEELLEVLEEELGKNVKIRLEITDKDKLSKKKRNKLADEIEENYDIKSRKIKAAYELEVEINIKGKEDDYEEKETMYAVKIAGKWYIVGSDGSFFPDSYV